jgi:serine/threonine protein kinase
VAVKFISRASLERNPSILVLDVTNPMGPKIPSEVAILQQLNHPAVIQYIEHIWDPRYLIVVQELGGTEWDVDSPDLQWSRDQGFLKVRNRIEGDKARDLFECIGECENIRVKVAYV